jgi:pilus assembly protein CpaB
MKSRVLLTIFLSLILAAVAAMLANSWINKRLGATETVADMAPVVAAAVDIPAGTKVDPTYLKLVQLPRGEAPKGAFAEPKELIGQVAKQSVYAGEIILASRISQLPAGSPLAAVIPEGKRAITVRVNDVIGVAGFLLPGSRVDVIATSRKGESHTILQDIKVLAVDQTTTPQKDAPVVVRAVTLEVDPAEAEVMVKATQLGSVQLTLRNPLDSTTVADEPAAPVADEPAKAADRPRETGLFSIDVIRGVLVSTTTVRQ